MAGPEESRVGALTQVEGPSGLAQLRLQLLPVSQRVGELLQSDSERGEAVRVHRGGGGQGRDRV